MSNNGEREIIVSPEGRVINHSIFEKDAFVDPAGRSGSASYKIEMAFEWDDVDALEDKVVEAVIGKWGEGAEKDYDDGRIRSPILDGDELAAEREAKGKKGDAYKGKFVVRANTVFNKNGENEPGGIMVLQEDTKELPFTDREKIYNGVYGRMAVVVQAYDGVGGGMPGVKFYLTAFQRTKDGERLMAQRDYSNVFAPVQSGGEVKSGRRRSRAG